MRFLYIWFNTSNTSMCVLWMAVEQSRVTAYISSVCYVFMYRILFMYVSTWEQNKTFQNYICWHHDNFLCFFFHLETYKDTHRFMYIVHKQNIIFHFQGYIKVHGQYGHRYVRFMCQSQLNYTENWRQTKSICKLHCSYVQ